MQEKIDEYKKMIAFVQPTQSLGRAERIEAKEIPPVKKSSGGAVSYALPKYIKSKLVDMNDAARASLRNSPQALEQNNNQDLNDFITGGHNQIRSPLPSPPT